MRKIISVITFCLFLFVLFSFKNEEKILGEKILKKMYNRYYNKWHTNLIFDQTTENYVEDSLVKTATWHETIVYPDHFRISFGDVANGNAVIFIKDSSYNFSKGKMVRKGLKGEDLTFLLGGMFFIPFENVKNKMIKEGFDITAACETNWKGNKTYVIGANNIGDKKNQLWIDMQKLIVMKFVKYKGYKY